MKTSIHKEIIETACASLDDGYGKIANDWLHTSQGFGVEGHTWLVNMQVHIDAFALFRPENHFDKCQITEGLVFFRSEWRFLEEVFDRWDHVNNNLNGAKVHNYGSQLRMDFALRTLSSLAHVLHSVSDFYSRTNWVEQAKGEIETFDFLNVKAKKGRFKTPAGTDLHSGAFSFMDMLFGYPLHSHCDMNKDNRPFNRGQEVIETGSFKGKTMNDLAKADAIRSSIQILEEFGKLVGSRTAGN